MLDVSLVKSYCTTFLGYGEPCSSWWFIGPEDGGTKVESEAQKRLDVWHRRGRQPIEDAQEYHWAIDEYRWHGHPSPTSNLRVALEIQRTWRPFISFRLASESATFNDLTTNERTAAIKEYQQAKLGRQNGVDCVLDLLPFPVRQWCTSREFSTERTFSVVDSPNPDCCDTKTSRANSICKCLVLQRSRRVHRLLE
jgi:hypothetical protein